MSPLLPDQRCHRHPTLRRALPLPARSQPALRHAARAKESLDPGLLTPAPTLALELGLGMENPTKNVPVHEDGCVRIYPAHAARRQSNRSVIRLSGGRHPSAMMLLAPFIDHRAPPFPMRPRTTGPQPPPMTPDPTGMPFARQSP